MKKEKRSTKKEVLSFVSLFPLLVVGLFISQAAPASSSASPAPKPAMQDMQHAQAAVVSGDQVKDKDAFRLFFLSIAVGSNSTAEEQARQRGLLAGIGLSPEDVLMASAILNQYNKDYSALIQSYNDSVAAATSVEELPDSTKLGVDIDAITLAAASKLNSQLSPKGARSLFLVIQKEKAHMSVTGE